MRTLGAAAAALSFALLVSACAGPDSAEPAAASSASPEASATAAADPTTTCAGYYDGGELSIHERVTTWTSAVAEPATEENQSELVIIQDRLSSQIRYAQDGPATLLEAIQEPFVTSIEGGSGDPSVVEESAAAFATLCDEAGYVLPE
ncbi:hypothetical protein [Isoptericola aurantiacus]|uniref:hypothetical protein n=1 Tax=Isoptericola aurantiacus TaxID=3377839 RepID=UPI00383AF899